MHYYTFLSDFLLHCYTFSSDFSPQSYTFQATLQENCIILHINSEEAFDVGSCYGGYDLLAVGGMGGGLGGKELGHEVVHLQG